MSISPQQEYRICTAWKPLHIYSQVWLRGRQCGCSAVPVTGLYWLCYVIRACWQQAYSQSAPSYQNTDIYCIAIGKYIYSQVWLRGRQWGQGCIPVTGLYWLCYVIRACWQQAYSQSAPSYQNTDIYCIAIGKYIYSQVWLRGRQWGQGCIPVTGLYWLYYVIGPVGSRPIVSPHTQLPNTDINCSTW